MRIVPLTLFLSFLITLPGCGFSGKGHELCRALRVDTICGIADDVCLDRLQQDPRFVDNNIYGFEWEAEIRHGRCVLPVTDFKTQHPLLPGIEPNEDIDFDVGLASDEAIEAYEAPSVAVD